MIDKNPALVKIDEVLDESFKSDYYFEYAKKVFPDPQQLRDVQVWGGEPWLRMDRVYKTIKDLFTYYPNCHGFMASTNFVNDPFMEQFKGLLEVFKSLNKEIQFPLQLSIDGPKEYTDPGRGEGVTEKFVSKFHQLIAFLETYDLKNIHLRLMFKPTLNMDSIKLLQTYDQVLAYFKFFEEFQDVFNQSKVNRKQVELLLPIPNTACPTPHTKEDGVLFANTVKACREVEASKVLRYYNEITPFGSGTGMRVDYNDMSYRCVGGTCNSGNGLVGLLPNNLISMCHMAFVDTLGDFKHEVMKNQHRNTSLDETFFEVDNSHPLTIRYEDLERFERKIGFFYKKDTTARLSIVTNTIQLEALVGNINKRFMNINEAIRAARFLTGHTSYCIRDCLGVGGSLSTYPVGLIRLLFNGAEEYLL